ncbi:MAG: helix-turn-helix transcriptional regulator [Pirellulales bacterium]|nr:helix-turn-helix transcriptional regulator [Pirellulales bacterium]
MSDHAADNLSRLMADQGLSIHQAARQTGVDERTIRAILGGNKPHARTLNRLAKGLDVRVDEFYVDPSQLLYRRFDRRTNPVIEEVMETHKGLFAGWGEADFDELHSRMGTGGVLTFEGALAAVRQMNRKRELHEKLDVLLESSRAEDIGGIVDVLYGQVVVQDGTE